MLNKHNQGKTGFSDSIISKMIFLKILASEEDFAEEGSYIYTETECMN